MLRRSIESLELLIVMLRRLRAIAEEHGTEFSSPGFSRFFAMITRELDEDYFQLISGHPKELRLRHGVMVSASLGYANNGGGYTLVRPNPREGSWVQRIYRKLFLRDQSPGRSRVQGAFRPAQSKRRPGRART